MNREEVLRKSRKENKGADLYEESLMKEGGNVAFFAILILAVVFTSIQTCLHIEMTRGFWSMMFILPSSGCAVRAFRTKDKWDIIRTIAGWGAVALTSALYIRDLLAAAVIL